MTGTTNVIVVTELSNQASDKPLLSREEFSNFPERIQSLLYKTFVRGLEAGKKLRYPEPPPMPYTGGLRAWLKLPNQSIRWAEFVLSPEEIHVSSDPEFQHLMAKRIVQILFSKKNS